VEQTASFITNQNLLLEMTEIEETNHCNVLVYLPMPHQAGRERLVGGLELSPAPITPLRCDASVHAHGLPACGLHGYSFHNIVGEKKRNTIYSIDM
jgi:hypothetical protein